MNRREKLEKMLQGQPEDPFLHYGLAMELIKEGDIMGGLSRFDRTLEIDRDYVAAYFHKANTLIGQNRSAEARAALLDGIQAAQRKQDAHALDEMQGLLDTISGSAPD